MIDIEISVVLADGIFSHVELVTSNGRLQPREHCLEGCGS